MPRQIEKDSFVRSPNDIKQVIAVLESHKGLFVINDVVYNDILYCGTDNLYFSYCFNYITGRALEETLLIVDTITQISEQSFLIKSANSEILVYLKE